MKHWRWGLVPLGLLLFGWGSLALGSYVYLRGMGYRDEFEYPWCQLWILIPYIIADGWRGLPSLMTWSWCLAGILSTLMPGVVTLILLFQRMTDRRRQPSLYGKTGWADRREMRRGGFRTDRSPF
jgi:hypothetical protein